MTNNFARIRQDLDLRMPRNDPSKVKGNDVFILVQTLHTGEHFVSKKLIIDLSGYLHSFLVNSIILSFGIYIYAILLVNNISSVYLHSY